MSINGGFPADTAPLPIRLALAVARAARMDERGRAPGGSLGILRRFRFFGQSDKL